MGDPRTQPSVGWPAPVVDLLLALAESRRLVLLLVVLGAMATVGWVLVSVKYYESVAVAVLMPREKPRMDATIRTSLFENAEDASRQSGSGALMLPSAPELYVELLRSDRVLLELAAKFRARFPGAVAMTTVEQVGALRSCLKVVGSEEGLLSVTVRSADPELAADMANVLLQTGKAASDGIERSLLQEQVECLDAAIRDAERRVASEESRLRTFYGEHRMLNPEQESTENLRQIRETQMLRDRLARELEERSCSYTERDAGVQRLRAQIAAANGRLAVLEQRRAQASSGAEYGDLLVDYEQLESSIRRQRDFVQTLRAKRSIYRVRSEQPGGALVVIKDAVASKTPAGPRRKRGILVGCFATAVAAVGLSVLRRQWRAASASREWAERLERLQTYLPLRRRVAGRRESG